MSGCLPKPYKLGWHIPNFVNGSTPCNLQTFNETKSKLLTNGVLLVSKIVGSGANSITVEWSVGPEIPNSTPGGFDQYVTLTINGTSYGSYRQIYFPATTNPVAEAYWAGDVVQSFRNALNNDPTCPVYIPSSYNFNFGGDVYVYTTDPTHISSNVGPTNMVDGRGAPSDTSTLRTGPMYSLVHIANSEQNNMNGTMVNINETRYFNGALWKEFNPSADPCAYLGSPCYGSPACYGSPRADF